MIVLGILFTIFVLVCGVALALALAFNSTRDDRQEYMSRIDRIGD